METVPVPILNQNGRVHSYTHLQVEKPYIALNSETYISLRQQELRTCKRIGYEFYCEEQTLPINLNISGFDKTLLNAPTTLKDFINSYTKQKEIFGLQERYETTILNANKNFFSDNCIVDIFVFISTIISLPITTLTVYLLCKHKKIRALIASLVLHQVKEVGATSR